MSRIGGIDGSVRSVVTNVWHFRVSKRDRCAAGLLRGDVGNNWRCVSKQWNLRVMSRLDAQLSQATHSVSSFDRRQDHGRKPDIVKTNISQNVALLSCAGTELTHNPPCQAIYDVGQLTIRDSAETCVIRISGHGPKTVYFFWLLFGETINDLRP
jgi:hypothetical protein